MVVGELATEVDVVVLGAGPAGYVAALRLAQLGRQVVLADPHPPGGVCLRAGCIPAKALLNAANRYAQTKSLDRLGILVELVALDWGRLQSWKDSLVDRLSGGVQQLLAQRGVEQVRGAGHFINSREVRLEAEFGAQRYIFEQAVIAVGAAPAALPGLPFDGRRVLTPAQALTLAELPPQLTIVGADYIAAELATMFAKFGAAVRWLLPAGQPLLPEFDPAAGRYLQVRLKKLGVSFEINVPDVAAATAADPGVVVSAGVAPRTGGLHLDAAGVATDAAGFIPVNDRMQTNQPAIYAVGDVTGGPPLAHLALKQGKVAADSIAGRVALYPPQAVPRVAWTDPQLATVGLTEAAATAAGYRVKHSRFPLGASGRALTLADSDGFVLVVAEQDSEVLLGVTIVGPHAESLIGEAALALEMGATLTDLAETLHPHPGLGESLQEAVEAALGLPVHIK